MKLRLEIILPALVFILIIIPLSIYSTVMDTNNITQNNTTVLNVPDVRQPSNYTSGPASLQAVLAYYGTDVTVDDLINMTNTTPENGTLPNNIAQTARQKGFNAETKENMTLQDLQESINQGTPVIINCQAWRTGNTTGNWTDDQKNSHYMVVIGIDNQNVYLEDPAILGSRGYIPLQEFLERWHDTFIDPKTGNNTTNNHLGIIITGKEPSTPSLYIKIN